MPQLIPKNIQRLIDIYIKAQEQLIKAIAEKEARGNIVTYQNSLLKQVNQIIVALDKQAKEWAGEVIPDYYRQGIEDAIQGLKDSGQDVTANIGLTQIHQGAINVLVRNAYADLNDANNYVGRRIQDVIRQASIDEVTNKFTTGLTVQELKKNIANKLIQEGINGIKDKRGRNISLDAYASTVARSTTREATNTATKNQLTSLDYDLVKMSSHATTCPICSIYQGRVYSISGRHPEYPPLDTAFSGDYANIHPNCRHVLMPYIPELDDNAESLKEFSNRPFEIAEKDKKSINAYNKQQAEKRKLRVDRNQYQKYLLALPNEAPKSFANFRRMKYNSPNKWNELKSKYSQTVRYNKMIIESTNLHIKGKVIKDVERIDISDFKFDDLHINSERNHNVTKEMAQNYINNAQIAYSRWKGEVVYYISEKGSTMVNLREKIVSTAYTRDEFDTKTIKILEVIKNDKVPHY